MSRVLARLVIAAFVVAASVGASAHTWHVDSRATTGSNNGAKNENPDANGVYQNAWRTLYDSAYGTLSGTVAAGDTIQVHGGPYFEATNATSTARCKATDISFNASARTITSAATCDFSVSFNTSGAIIRVMGSSSNDGQYTVASAGVNSITLNSTNALTDESAGASVRVVNISSSQNTFVLDQGRNGSSTSPITWQLNGTRLSAGLELVSSSYRWVQYTNKWCVQRANGTNPSLLRPDSVVWNGLHLVNSAEVASRQMSNAGVTWEDPASLGYSTVCVQSTSAPSSFLANQIRRGVLYQNYTDHEFIDGVWEFGNGSANGSDDGATVVGRGARTVFRNMHLRWASGNCFDFSSTGPFTVINTLTQWCGHRGYALTAAITANVYNSVDWSGHLALLISAAGTVNWYNNLCLNAAAGCVDKRIGGATFNEDYNHWRPLLVRGTTGIGYSSVAWTTITLSATSGTVTITPTGGTQFASTDVGRTLSAVSGNGTCTVASYNAGTGAITCTTSVAFDTTSYAPAAWLMSGMWTSTAAHDSPPNTPTITNSPGSFTDPQISVTPTETDVAPEYFRPKLTSPLLRSGGCPLTTGCIYRDRDGRRGFVPPHNGMYQVIQ